MALLLAAVAGVGIIGAAGIAAGSAAVAGTVLYKKKKNEDDKLKHKALLSSLGEQWDKERTNMVDPVLFPKSFSTWESTKLQISQEIVSVGMGWDNESGSLSIDEVQVFCAAFNKKGKLIELVTPHYPETNFGITHTGLTPTPKFGRTYSGQPDKQNIVINLAQVSELKEEIHYLIIGTIITATTPVIDAYLALFNGTDVNACLENSALDPAVLRLNLDQEQCGFANAFIMGGIVRDDDNLGNWYYNPIRTPVSSKTIRDIVPRMQQLIITPDLVPNSSKINFISEKPVESIWFGFDRFGYQRFCKEQQFPKDNIDFQDFNLTDGVTKIFLVTITNFNGGESFQIKTDDSTFNYPVIHSNIQVVCGFFAHEYNTTIPFPVRMSDDSVACIPFAVPINGDPSQSHIVRELREKYIPFTANSIAITIISGNNLSFLPKEGETPKKEKEISPVISVTFNKIKKKTTVKKATSSPEWNETVIFNIEQDWMYKESVLTFSVKDNKSGKLIGETGYDLKSLRIPYLGGLQLEKGLGSVYININAIEKPTK